MSEQFLRDEYPTLLMINKIKSDCKLLKRYKKSDKRRLHLHVTVDKMWLQSYKPGKKTWKIKYGSINKAINQPTIANRGKTTWKALYTIISNCYAKVAEFSKEKSRNVTKGVCIHKILSNVQKYCKNGKPKSRLRGIKLLHDTAPVHAAYSKRFA